VALGAVRPDLVVLLSDVTAEAKVPRPWKALRQPLDGRVGVAPCSRASCVNLTRGVRRVENGDVTRRTADPLRTVVRHMARVARDTRGRELFPGRVTLGACDSLVVLMDERQRAPDGFGDRQGELALETILARRGTRVAGRAV